MGFLGWTYDQTLDTPFGAIETAYEGRMEMMAKCFGGGEEIPPEAPSDTATVRAAFRSAIK